jgi:hypothetical protein
MPQQRFGINTGKNSKDDKKPSILSYWPVIIPLIIILDATNIYLQGRASIPKYHQDCSMALLSPNSTASGQPCVYKTANASLKDTYNGRGIRDGQDINLYFPDGSETFIGIGTVDNRADIGTTVNRMSHKRLADVQVDGVCQVEVWHGKVTAIINAKYRINSGDNPEEKGSNFIGFTLLMGVFSLILVIACVRFLPVQAAKSQ